MPQIHHPVALCLDGVWLRINFTSKYISIRLFCWFFPKYFKCLLYCKKLLTTFNYFSDHFSDWFEPGTQLAQGNKSNTMNRRSNRRKNLHQKLGKVSNNMSTLTMFDHKHYDYTNLFFYNPEKIQYWYLTFTCEVLFLLRIYSSINCLTSM